MAMHLPTTETVATFSVFTAQSPVMRKVASSHAEYDIVRFALNTKRRSLRRASSVSVRCVLPASVASSFYAPHACSEGLHDRSQLLLGLGLVLRHVTICGFAALIAVASVTRIRPTSARRRRRQPCMRQLGGSDADAGAPFLL